MDSADTFRQAILLAKAGQREQARQMLAHLVMQQPDHELAWVWLSDLVDSPEQQRYCLRRALAINPANVATQRRLGLPAPAPTTARAANIRPLAYSARTSQRYAWIAVATALAVATLFIAYNIVQFVSTASAARPPLQANAPTLQIAPSPTAGVMPLPTPDIGDTRQTTRAPTRPIFPTPTSEFYAWLALTLTPTPSDDSIAPYLKRAAQLAQQDRFYDAWDEYERALKVWPDHIGVLYQRALMAYEMDRSQRAVTDLNRALEVNPQFVQGYILRGQVNMALLRYVEALRDFGAALAFQPDNATAWYSRGRVYQQLGEDQNALVNFNRALDLKPEYAEALAARGDVYFEQGNVTLARISYQDALACNDKLADAHIGLGRIELALQSYDQAIQDFYKALAIRPGDEDAMMYLGQALVLDGQYTTAVATLDQAIRAVTPAPKQAVMYEWRGRAQFALGNYSKAIQDLSLAIARYPTAERFYYRGLAYQAAGNTGLAKPDFKRCLEGNELEPELSQDAEARLKKLEGGK